MRRSLPLIRSTLNSSVTSRKLTLTQTTKPIIQSFNERSELLDPLTLSLGFEKQAKKERYHRL